MSWATNSISQINAYAATASCFSSCISTDVAVTSLIEPTSGKYCSINPQIKARFRNDGTSSINSLIIKYTIDGGATQSTNWTGNIEEGKFKEIFISDLSLSNGTHTVEVWVELPVGQTDEYSANNRVSTSFDFNNNESLFYTAIKNDINGSETTWEVKNTSNTILAKGGPFGEYASYLQIPFCALNTECLSFTIKDAGGNGINTPVGNYGILNEGKIELFKK